MYLYAWKDVTTPLVFIALLHVAAAGQEAQTEKVPAQGGPLPWKLLTDLDATLNLTPHQSRFDENEDLLRSALQVHCGSNDRRVQELAEGGLKHLDSVKECRQLNRRLVAEVAIAMDQLKLQLQIGLMRMVFETLTDGDSRPIDLAAGVVDGIAPRMIIVLNTQTDSIKSWSAMQRSANRVIEQLRNSLGVIPVQAPPKISPASMKYNIDRDIGRLAFDVPFQEKPKKVVTFLDIDCQCELNAVRALENIVVPVVTLTWLQIPAGEEKGIALGNAYQQRDLALAEYASLKKSRFSANPIKEKQQKTAIELPFAFSALHYAKSITATLYDPNASSCQVVGVDLQEIRKQAQRQLATFQEAEKDKERIRKNAETRQRYENQIKRKANEMKQAANRRYAEARGISFRGEQKAK